MKLETIITDQLRQLALFSDQPQRAEEMVEKFEQCIALRIPVKTVQVSQSQF